MNRKKSLVFLVVILLLAVFAVGSYTKFHGTKTVNANFTKKSYFLFDLVVALDNTALGPGETASVEPKVISDSTEEMYVFIKVTNPRFNGEPLYEYRVDESWILIDNTIENVEVYAYASESVMTVLGRGEETIPLITEVRMRDISYPEYGGIEDITVSFQVFALGTDDMSANPTEVWEYAKEYFLEGLNI